MEISTAHYTLEIDERTGTLESLRAGDTEEGLLSPDHGTLPLFVIQYLDEERRFHQVSSREAERSELRRSEQAGEVRLEMEYTRVGGLELDVSVTVRCPQDAPLSYWSLSLRHRAPMVIANVQFPYVVVPYSYDGDTTNLLVPSGLGVLYEQPRPEQLEPDYPNAWWFTEEGAHFVHYPGTTFAQFLAYYDDRRGIYVGCHDASGKVKIIKPLHHESGIRMGIAHAVGWDQPGEHSLGYEVALGPFSGDWYDAADIYRQWHGEAHASEPTLSQRQDVPSWLLDSPVHVVLRIQGELDAGPAEPNPEFVPYEHALPLLDRLAEAVDAPLVPIIMSWEHPGPWVYPNSFPVAGGDESLRTFTAAARSRGWHVGTYCNGTRWVIGHRWTGYDGEEYYETHDGEETVCRLPEGLPWRESWDRYWRPSYMCCVGVPRTREIAVEFVQHLLDLGLDWIQFLDQNCGAAAFPCYSWEHGHPSAPGAWMTDALSALLAGLEEVAGASGREIVYSVESAPNDYFRGHFQICDIRPNPSNSRYVPLYQYLFHEYILTQGAFAIAPNPYWMQIKTAYSFVMGDILTAIMGPGRLMNWAGHPWASWDTPPGNQEAILALLSRATALRRSAGRDFLTYGRLLRPASIQGIEQLEWVCEEQVLTSPAVLHARWRSPDGRTAIALANWTEEEREVELPRPADGAVPRRYHLQHDTTETVELDQEEGIRLTLPPLSVALVEYAG